MIKRMGSIGEAFSVSPDEYDGTVVICSYDSLVNTWDFLQAITWDIGVLDECHFIKRQATRRAKYCHKLRDVCSKRVALTGTPIANSHLDLYSQLEFLGQGYSGFKSWNAWKSFYGVFTRLESQDGMKKLVGAQNLPFLKERLAKLAYLCLLYTSPSPRDRTRSRMPSSA